MFNVRPDAQSPWLHVEPRQADGVPGFRVNLDGSVGDTPRTDLSSANPTTPSDAPPPRPSLQDAICQIIRLYAPFAAQMPGAPSVPRGIESGTGVWTFGQTPSPNVAASEPPKPMASFVAAASDKGNGVAIVEERSGTPRNDPTQQDIAPAVP